MEESSFSWRAFFFDYLRWCGIFLFAFGLYLSYGYIAVPIQKMHDHVPSIEIKMKMMSLCVLILYYAPALIILGEKINGNATSLSDMSPLQYAYLVLFVVVAMTLYWKWNQCVDDLGYEVRGDFLQVKTL